MFALFRSVSPTTRLHFHTDTKHSAVALLASYASAAIVISVPTNATSSSTITVTWTSQPGDPSVFSLELTNPSFHQDFAVGNNLDTSLGTFTFELPVVPAE